jgi:protein O-mannosyl-transferase
MDLSRSRAFKCMLITAACFVCYGNTILNDYAYDDSVVITENKFTQKGIDGIPDIFTNNTFVGSYENVPVLDRYRPLSLATFAVERAIFGQNPHVSHFNNVLLFVLTALVLYLLLLKLFGGRHDADGFLGLPFVAAMVFAVHPVHTEIVANIKGRDEILVLAGSLSATLLVLKYLDARRFLHLAVSFCLFLMALFSKENAMTFLAVVPLTIFYYKRTRWTEYFRSLLPLILASVIFLGVRAAVLGGAGPLPPADILTEPFAFASASTRFATIVYTLGMYLKLLFFPHPLTIDYYPYHIQLMNWGNAAVWLSLLVYVALLAFALWNLRKRDVVSYGILFYLSTLSVVSNVPFSMGTFMSERFIFVPSLGFAIILAWLVSSRLFPSIGYRRAVVLVISLACVLKTYSRNAVWKDDFTLFTTDVKISENSIKANMAASVTFLLESYKTRDGALSAEYRANALKHSKKAVAIYQENVDPARLKGTSYSSAVMLLGNCYNENGMLEEALLSYRSVVQTAPDRTALCEMIQTTINKSSDVDFKIKGYTEFANLVPDSFSFNYHLGLLYGKDKNDLPMSVSYFKKAVEIDPKDVNALRGLSHAYTLSSDYELAAFYFKGIVDKEPDNLSLLGSLRGLYRQAGNRAGEEEVAKRMMELEQDHDK